MVKRQTVWLSTMMVLSLMLIGYYTVNNGAGTSTTTGGADTVTTAGSGTDSGSSQASGTDSNGSSKAQSQSHATNTSDDWFLNARTKLEQNMAQDSQMYQGIIASDKSSNSQVVQAQQEVKQLTALEGSLSNARDAVLAEGYSDCVIFPTIDSKTGNVENLQVYVKASKLSSDKALQIMNVVSQNMGVDINHIIVHEHA